MRNFVTRRWRLLSLVVFGVLVVGGAGAAVARTQLPVKVAMKQPKSVTVTGPVAINFSQEVSAEIEPEISPQVKGNWSESKGLLGVWSVRFTPAVRLESGTDYTVKLHGLKRALTGAELDDITQKFTTQAPAEVVGLTPGSGAQDVATGTLFTVKLATANRGVRKLRAKLTPDVPLVLAETDDVTYKWRPSAPLAQDTAYTLELLDDYVTDPARQKLRQISFTTVNTPKITSARQGGYFVQGQSLEIKFDRPMNTTGQYINFDTPGTGKWVNESSYQFTPAGLKPGESHQYVIKAGLRSKAGGVVQMDHNVTYQTTGAIGANLSPWGGNIGLKTPIKVAFDQPVDKASAQARFSVSPGTAGSITWSGNTLIFTPESLEYQTGYTYSVAPGVTPAWGLPNTRPLTGTFSTLIPSIKLPVPAYFQPYASSCEVTALRMALAYRGINTNELDIVTRVGYNPRARDLNTNSWDDPDVQFVGNINGSQPNKGYGTHAPPIAKAAKSYGRNATVHYGLTAPFIAARLYEGNPVIFWGHSFTPKIDQWNLPGGGVSKTWINSHGRIVIGVNGRPDNPSGFWINDGMTGKTSYWSPSELMANINSVGAFSNQGVVIY